MEKKRPGSSSGKPSPSKSSSFSKPSSSRPSKPSSSSHSKPSGFFSKPAHRPEPKAEHHTDADLKERIREKKAGAFEKPEHDPGFKNRPVQSGTGYVPGTTDQVTDTSETTGGRGRGCCGSISGFMSLIAILAAIVVVVFLVKCL